MFKSFLTPLRARFDISPRPEVSKFPPAVETPEEMTPEDFARDVLVELTRTSVESLKVAEDVKSRTAVLLELQRIILQDACTKDVFRELDGFLALMSVLSTLQTTREGPVMEPEERVLSEVQECSRLVFMLASEAMRDHKENSDYFRDKVGYESLLESVQGLVTDPKTVEQTLGFITSFSLHNFAVSGIFDGLQGTDHANVDLRMADIGPRMGMIHEMGAIQVLWDSIPILPGGDVVLRYAIYKMFEVLLYLNHRNQIVFGNLSLVKPLFELFNEYRADAGMVKERQVVQRLLRRTLDVNATTAESRIILQRSVRDNDVLDTDILEVVRWGMKSRWPEHFSMESPASLMLTEEGIRGMPMAGFTFMAWLWIEKQPTNTHSIFSFRMTTRTLFTLSLRRDGKLEVKSTGSHDVGVFTKSNISEARWIHLTLVHYPHRVSNPTIRLFVDGVLVDTVNWAYPKAEGTPQTGTYAIGDSSNSACMSWCLASCYLISTPLADDLPRLIHHLGPRYCGIFQDPYLVRFLTYEASTSLNMFLATMAGKVTSPNEISPLVKAVRDGLSIAESSVVFAISPSSVRDDALQDVPKAPSLPTTPSSAFFLSSQAPKIVRSGPVEQKGNVFPTQVQCLDMALWKVGGTAIALRLVQIANSPHEISRALGILADALRNSWQNSEDMERLRGYDILANILRNKTHIINMTGFETLFEFLGLNFRTPELSTVVNSVAYRAIALDFELWAQTRKEIQRVHLEHFTTLLYTSRFKRFNAKRRFASLGLVRKLLFVLQTDWYQYDMIPFVVDALKIAAQVNFSSDDAIKPIVSFLAANLHEVTVGSPRSVTSRIDYNHRRERAELVMEALLAILSVPSEYTKFTATLPLTRICILLLGEHPTPIVATQVLLLIAMSLNVSSSFSRKFELVSGWSVLRIVLPSAWDPSVHEAVFDVLLGRTPRKNSAQTTVVCPHIVPAIFTALHRGLDTVATRFQITENSDTSSAKDASSQSSLIHESSTEVLVEELIDLHASSPTFRQVFRSQQTTQLFIDAYKAFVSTISSSARSASLSPRTISILEKVSRFALTLTLESDISGPQKRQMLEIQQSAEPFYNHDASQKPAIDPDTVIDHQARRLRLSGRFSVQVGERTTNKSLARMHEWRNTIIATERKRLRKTVLDLRENHRQISRLTDWAYPLTSERGLWQHRRSRAWRLDETEGPYRIRKKLEPQHEEPSSRVDAVEQIRDVDQPEADTQSIFQVEVPPWAESYEITATDVEDDRQLTEEVTEDKHRRVRHELEPGDVIEAVTTVARIDGVDSSPGLLIFGRTHLYMLDGLVENDDGEVIDAHDAPRKLFFVPGSIVELDGPQRAQRWAHDQLSSFSDRTFLFRDVALEIYFKDSRSLLMVFLDKKRRLEWNQRLSSIVVRGGSDTITPGLLKTPLLGKMSARVMAGFRGDSLSTAQRKWQAREISNFTYLSILNQISGRTPSDATQYPIFPWVLKDYASEELDLHAQESYRDLTKPMGALTPSRREAAHTRYVNLESVEEKPFHYGTHFSSSMIVCHFLIRLAPFTNMFKTLQGGDWDLPDRLFSEVARAYDSAARDVRGDVRELIPEFYTCPEFLENSANHDFGIQQNTGEKIHDVKLPPWAKQDPLLFIILNRRALESDYVSENLPAWIDLIWGCKQRDPESLNAFHPLSYEGSIDLDSITDELEREATVGIIHNFGQTPRKLFNSPHPVRYMHGLSTLPIGTLHGIEEDGHLLIQEPRPIKDLGPGVPVRDLVLDIMGDRIIPCIEGVLSVPSHPHEQIEWRPRRVGVSGGGELRVIVDQKVVQVVEAAFCTCAALADSYNLVTGSSDYAVRLWRISRGSSNSSTSTVNSPAKSPKATRTHVQGGGTTSVHLSHIMKVHTAKVLCVTASRTWSIVVSGSADGSAAIWDLNKGVYVRSVWHKDEAAPSGGAGNLENERMHGVHVVAINESTGYIATCSRSKLLLHTINARPMASLSLLPSPSGHFRSPSFSNPQLSPHPYPHHPSNQLPVTCLAFHEREYSKLGVLATGGSDGTITLRTWTTDGTPKGEKAKWEFVTMRVLKARECERANGTISSGMGRIPKVTALKFIGESLCHGEDSGKAFMWTLPE